MIAKVVDADGRITVPGFYDDVEEVPQAERDMIAHIPFNEEKYKNAIGVKELFGEKVTVRWSVTVVALHSTFAASGVDIPVKVLKQYFHPKLQQKYPAVWFRIRTTTRFRKCLPIIFGVLLRIRYK